MLGATRLEDTTISGVLQADELVDMLVGTTRRIIMHCRGMDHALARMRQE